MATIEITEGARDTIQRMKQRAFDLSVYGDPYQKKAQESLAHCLATILCSANWIGSDGDLSLITTWTSGLMVGVNFSTASKPPEDERFPDMWDGMPDPGTWSLNS